MARVKRPFFSREIGPRLFESNIQVPINDLMLNVPTGLAICSLVLAHSLLVAMKDHCTLRNDGILNKTSCRHARASMET